LKQAIDHHAEFIVINAFGCGEFGNLPETVGDIFCKKLTEMHKDLRGKSIFFIDLNLDKCITFGKIFSESLKNLFDINLYPQKKNQLHVLLDELKTTEMPSGEALVMHKNYVKKPGSLFYSYGDLKTTKGNEKNYLKEQYAAIIASAVEQKKTVLHM